MSTLPRGLWLAGFLLLVASEGWRAGIWCGRVAALLCGVSPYEGASRFVVTPANRRPGLLRERHWREWERSVCGAIAIRAPDFDRFGHRHIVRFWSAGDPRSTVGAYAPTVGRSRPALVSIGHTKAVRSVSDRGLKRAGKGRSRALARRLAGVGLAKLSRFLVG